MMASENRIELLVKLADYMTSEDEQWAEVKLKARLVNAWFTDESIYMAIKNICNYYLQPDTLRSWIAQYTLPSTPKTVGIVMAGNIPLVGFHDFLCGFMAGQNLKLKLSSKDEVLLKHIIQKLAEWDERVATQVAICEMLKGCDAYIATGSNNSARYFEQYFGKYANLIRRNRTSVAVLTGEETPEELKALAKDVFSYFGLGCRNVTQVCVPEGYKFDTLLGVFDDYRDIANHHKYKNNYDYHLAIYLLNRVPYLTNESILLVENEIPFSAVSVLHYQYYSDKEQLTNRLKESEEIQCIVGSGEIPFGQSQQPSISEYADGVDTMKFLCSL